MNRCIIIEGPQGVGKTTLVEYLRDNIAASNLYRLSGQKDKTQSGKELSTYMYSILQDYIDKMQKVPMDLIFDRTFFTEEVYARAGFKEYSFTDVYHELVKRLESTSYEVYLVILYLKDPLEYGRRLKRVHHNYQQFSIEGSTKQQEIYLQLGKELENTNIHVRYVAMDDFEKGYEEINHIFNIHNKEDDKKSYCYKK